MSYRSNSILYFHMPRTAGDSIRESITNFPDKCCIITHDKIRPDIFKKSVITSFTFIRNPYDRLYSAYNWIANRDVKNNEKLNEFDTREYNFLQKQNFKDFNDFASSITYDDITQDFMIHFCPMWRWISDNRTAKILIRNIFLYEDIENFKFDKYKKYSFPSFCKENNLILSDLPRIHFSNWSEKDYLKYYNKKSILNVNKIYSRDFEIWPYSKIS